MALSISQITAAAPPEAPPETASAQKPTLFLIGDSTMRNGTKGQRGWGDEVAPLFDTQRITVVNRGRGGRSSRTFHTEGLWQKVLDDARPGDFVLIQFGHNDGGKLDDDRARGSIRGIGDETKDITKPDGTQETVHTYGWYLRKYITDAREHGLTPIVLSYVPRCPRPAPGSAAKHGLPGEPSSYALWAQEIAQQEGALFVPVFTLIATKYAPLTPETIKQTYFGEADFTHTNTEGARLNAQTVVEGMRDLKDCPLVQYLKEPGL